MALITLLGVLVDGPLDPSVPSNTAVQVDWPRGTDASIDLRLIDQDSNKVDLDLVGSDRLELSVRSSLGGDTLFSRLATKQTEFGLYTFAIVSNDTVNLGGRYIMDAWVTKAAVQRQVVAPSYFNVSPRMRTP